jgi:hypothetical protein
VVIGGLSGAAVAAGTGAALAALAGAAWRTWPPIVGDAVRKASLIALPFAVVLPFVLRGETAAARAALALSAVAAVSVFSAEGCRANAEAGWRRGAAWAGAVLLPTVGVGAVARWLPGAGASDQRAAAWCAAATAVLAWVPAAVAESARVRTGLEEEVRLGLMPAEDAAVLAFPWKRAREPRFGQRDERREYVRSALLLSVAHRQQTRREGQAARLRQLEILAFRTRLRRTLVARAERLAAADASVVDDLPN